MNSVLSAVLAAWLSAWFFWIGTLMGGLANVWLHNLTGGAWGEAIRDSLLRASRQLPVASLGIVPVLAGMHVIYTWTAGAVAEDLRWQGELSDVSFKSAWLSPGFFIARSIVWLLLWNALALMSRRPALARSKPFAAFALIVYGFSMSLAAVDWVMSLNSLWYSSVFGWLVGTGQMLAGMALGVACRSSAGPNVIMGSGSGREGAGLGRDLGNMLLMYVMMWAYLAFSQFLVIWAENLPHEITWYLERSQGPWRLLAWLLALFYFFAPLLVLLSRQAKQSMRMLRGMAVALLAMQFLNTCWLVLPSVHAPLAHLAWSVPLTGALLAAAAGLTWRPGTPAISHTSGGVHG